MADEQVPTVTPLQHRILRALEEAGSETFFDLLVEVTQADWLPGDRLVPNEWTANVLVKEVEGLIRMGFATMLHVAPGSDAASDLRMAASEVVWTEQIEHWQVTSSVGACRRIEVALTSRAYSEYLDKVSHY